MAHLKSHQIAGTIDTIHADMHLQNYDVIY